MGQDQHAVGVAEVALVLLHPLTGERPVELGAEPRLDQLGEGDPGDLGEIGAQLLGAGVVFGTGAEQVDQHAAGVADRLEDAAQAALVGVLDHHGRARQQVGADVGVEPAGIGGRHGGAGVVELAGQGTALDDHLEFHARAEHRVQQAADEFGLTDRQTPHLNDRRRGVVRVAGRWHL